MRLLEYGNFSELEHMFIDKTVKGAIEQLDERGYALEYAGDARKLSKIGVSLSNKTGTVSDFLVE